MARAYLETWCIIQAFFAVALAWQSSQPTDPIMPTQTLKGHTGNVYDIKFSADGTQLAPRPLTIAPAFGVSDLASR
jgi:hypothetical protein